MNASLTIKRPDMPALKELRRTAASATALLAILPLVVADVYWFVPDLLFQGERDPWLTATQLNVGICIFTAVACSSVLAIAASA